jgi:hypothetical protein
MRMVAVEGPWSSRLLPVAKTQPLIAAFESYYEWLQPVTSRIDIWMTTYVHAFDGPQSAADWFASSAPQPFLERLEDDGAAHSWPTLPGPDQRRLSRPLRRSYPHRLSPPVHRCDALTAVAWPPRQERRNRRPGPQKKTCFERPHFTVAVKTRFTRLTLCWVASDVTTVHAARAFRRKKNPPLGFRGQQGRKIWL